MLFPMKVLERIVAGEVTLAFRRWKRSPPRPGARLKTALGMIEVGEVREVSERAITEAEARQSGAASRAELLALLAAEGTLLRIEVRYAGEDPRIALRQERASGGAGAALLEKLTKIDARAEQPWAIETLALIERFPGRVARELAKQMKMETLAFKRRVRQLKELGLTESLEVGYRLSPRGRDVLALAREGRGG